MHDEVVSVVIQRTKMTHGWILKITRELTEEQMAWRLSQTGPPAIGWHLWHTSRWADRLQASFPNEEPEADQQPDSIQGIWETEGLVEKWGLDPDILGLLETGVLMDKATTFLLPQVGNSSLFDYAERTFAAVDQALDGLNAEQFHERRRSIMAYRLSGYSAVPAPGPETTVAADIGFHLSHASRHLGMIEVIRGMQGLRGTATL